MRHKKIKNSDGNTDKVLQVACVPRHCHSMGGVCKLPLQQDWVLDGLGNHALQASHGTKIRVRFIKCSA